MSQVPDWNAEDSGQPTPWPQYRQAYQQAPPYGQVNPQGMMMPAPGYGPSAPALPVPAGLYFDHLSGLILPNGTQLASVGRRIGSYFLALVLFIVTLGVGYLVWGAISWSKGQTPTQQILGMQTWKPQTRANATWGEQFLRELSRIMYIIPLIGWIIAIVSFFMFIGSREHRALHDQVGGTIVLHDPNRVLQPAAPR
jgi:uncharacterized RDD family membrane protein YckC